jgi:hypothetical protein
MDDPDLRDVFVKTELLVGFPLTAADLLLVAALAIGGRSMRREVSAVLRKLQSNSTEAAGLGATEPRTVATENVNQKAA